MVLYLQILIFLLSLGMLSSLLAAQAWTEAQVIERFMAQSPYARELQARVGVTRAEAQARTLYPNPILSYSREGAGRAEFFQAEQTLPLTGRIGFLRQAGTLAVQASEAETAALLWELRSAVRLAFYRGLASQEREAIWQTHIRELGEVVHILRAREREGEGSRFDRLRAERELAEARSEASVAQALTAQARTQLIAFLPNGSEIRKLAGSLVPTVKLPPLTELAARVLTVRADYRAEKQQWERYRWERKAAERLRYPEPTISAGVKRAEAFQGLALGPVVSLSVSLPLFNRGRTEMARLQAEQERAMARRQRLERQILAQVEGTYQALLIRQQTAEDYRREFQASGKELIQIAKIAYQEGELGILELLDAYRMSRQSELRWLELLASAKEAHIELERVLGEEVLP